MVVVGIDCRKFGVVVVAVGDIGDVDDVDYVVVVVGRSRSSHYKA